jgi:hypothetical protein
MRLHSNTTVDLVLKVGGAFLLTFLLLNLFVAFSSV